MTGRGGGLCSGGRGGGAEAIATVAGFGGGSGMGAGSSGCDPSAIGTVSGSDGGDSGPRTAGNRPSRSAMLVNWPGVTVFRLRS